MRQVQSVQLVWFVSAAPGLDAQKLYQAAFQVDPTNVQSNTVFSVSTPFLSQASGTRAGATYVTQVQPGRIDLVIGPSQELLREDGMPDLLEPTMVRDIAKSAIDAISPLMDACFRVGMTNNLMNLVDTADLAAKEIIAHTGLDLDPENVTDLAFSANRTKPISADLVMNRLMRFSVVQIQMSTIQQAGFHPGIVASQLTKFGALLSLDFNSVPLARSLSTSEQITVFDAIEAEAARFAVSTRAIGCLK